MYIKEEYQIFCKASLITAKLAPSLSLYPLAVKSSIIALIMVLKLKRPSMSSLTFYSGMGFKAQILGLLIQIFKLQAIPGLK